MRTDPGQEGPQRQSRDVEADEVWSFIQKKEKRVRPDDDPSFGDCYVFVGIERHSKLVLNIAVGKCDQATTDVFVEGIRNATAPSHFQITTDGFAPCKTAIPNTLGDRIDFAQLIKVYSAATGDDTSLRSSRGFQHGGSPSRGRPDPERISTSIVERQNLSVRMGTRRFTQLTNAFSKKWENHWAAVALWFAFYNFCRVHKPLRCTPAMEAKIADHIWTVRELLEAARSCSAVFRFGRDRQMEYTKVIIAGVVASVYHGVIASITTGQNAGGNMAAMGTQFSNPESVAKAGEKIYQERYREQYEPTHGGKFLVVDVHSEKAYLGDTPENAFAEAKKDAPNGLFHLIKIGSPGAFRVSYTSDVSSNWLYK